MTHVSIVAVSILTLLGIALASPIVKKEELKAAIIRRHEDSSEIRLSPTGEILLRASDGTTPTAAPSGGGGVSNDPCNREYKLGAADSPDCPTGTVPIVHPEDCERAAALVLNDDGTSAGLSAANHVPPNANFTIENGWQNPRAFPKNCLVYNGKVYYNPTEPTPTSYQGRALCEEAKYPSGTGNTASTSACPTGYEAVSTYNECHLAFGCASGYSGCTMPDFANAAQHISTTEPKGCFREPNGCFNFNWATTDGSSIAPSADMLANNGGSGMLHTVCKPTGSTVPGQ